MSWGGYPKRDVMLAYAASRLGTVPTRSLLEKLALISLILHSRLIQGSRVLGFSAFLNEAIVAYTRDLAEHL